MRRLLVGVVMAALAATACNWLGEARSKRAVGDAIRAHLDQNSRLKLDNFSTTMEQVKFNGSTAEARVKFQSKDSRNLSVEVGYVLRLEDGKWQVISSSPLSGQGMNPASPHENLLGPSGPSASPAGTRSSTPRLPAPEPSH